MNLASVIREVLLHTALARTQRDYRANVLLGSKDFHLDDRLANLFNLGRIRQFGWIFDLNDRSVTHQHFIDHSRRGRDQFHVEFALQALLHDVHVQKTEEPTTKSKPQGLRDFGFELQRGVV